MSYYGMKYVHFEASFMDLYDDSSPIIASIVGIIASIVGIVASSEGIQ